MENKLLSNGIEAFQRQRWSEAATLWKETYSSCKSSNKTYTAACAAANIAVAFEMSGDNVEATRWADNAINTITSNASSLSSSETRTFYANILYYKSLLK